MIEETSESEILPDSSCDDNDWGQDEIEIENNNPSPVSTSCLNCVSLSDELSRVRGENESLKLKNEILAEENAYLKSGQFNYENISKNTKTFLRFTGLALDKFHSLYDLVSPGLNCENIKYYERSLADAEPRSPNTSNIDLCDFSYKRGRKPKFHALD